MIHINTVTEYLELPGLHCHIFCHFVQEDEMDKRKSEEISTAQIEAEVKELRKENMDLKQYILALQGEVYGARLAAKYLDKELAGRWVV